MADGVVIERIDHMVLTVADIKATCDFYGRVLGMEKIVFAGGRVALGFGAQKINLHPAGNEYEPKAQKAVPGSADFCLITDTPMEAVIAHLGACGVAIIEGPVAKTGALGALTSVYFRDVDENLVEVSNYE
ncbi:MAG: VOC family protein [Proteobacteria bacterium]|nr:VOC family protein [Pseudomonadota bacterium]